jgi:hypothetical protein
MTELLKFAAKMARGSHEEKLLHALAPYTFDGTEIHRVVDLELRGLELEIAASNIRHAIVSQYRQTVPLEVVIEIVATLAE